eukprot:CAMPEP_0184495812 /NCGR_PEP_ID=MMETSP0113_2-20130426/32431_1 /TAXON_ID=91329 /ORGANISM="Norrisiella sphaerica, Strain BC52" /LENGTH=142 /DNA_ID=CAMNT_0026882175 /DNA_START=245 /DNA_END=673 /DNA_ORIENTATION=-
MSKKDLVTNKVTYCPQEEKYLRGSPADVMLDDFMKRISKQSAKTRGSGVKVLYKRCQRWGAAYPKQRVSANQVRDEQGDENAVKGVTIHPGAFWEIKTRGCNAPLFCAGDYVEPKKNMLPFECAVASGAASGAAVLKAAIEK